MALSKKKERKALYKNNKKPVYEFQHACYLYMYKTYRQTVRGREERVRQKEREKEKNRK